MQCIAASIAGVKIDYHEPNAVKADKGWMKTFLSALPKESTIASIIELLSDRVETKISKMPSMLDLSLE